MIGYYTLLHPVLTVPIGSLSCIALMSGFYAFHQAFTSAESPAFVSSYAFEVIDLLMSGFSSQRASRRQGIAGLSAWGKTPFQGNAFPISSGNFSVQQF